MAANALDIGVGSTKTPTRKEIAEVRDSAIDIDMGETAAPVVEPAPAAKVASETTDSTGRFFDPSAGRPDINTKPAGVINEETIPAPPTPIEPPQRTMTQLTTAPKIDTVKEHEVAPTKTRTQLTTAPKFDVVKEHEVAPTPAPTPEELEAERAAAEKARLAEEQRASKQKEADDIKAANDDFITSTTQFNADLADPNTPDAIKTAQMNELVAQFGPENQAATDSMMLQLKQQGLEGTGAGNAMMALMARGNQAQLANMTQRLNTESAQRIYDMNKWGADFGLRMSQNIRAEETKQFNENSSLLAVAAEAGDWQNFESVASDMGINNIDTAKLEQMDDFERAEFISRTIKNLGFAVESAETFSDITGLEIDPSILATLDPASQAKANSRLDAIKLITDPEAKKQAMIELAREMPEAFGFPGDPSSAMNMVSGMDFNNIEANKASSSDANSNLRSLAVQDNPDMNDVILAGKGLWTPWSDSYIDTTFTSQSENFGILDDVAQTEVLDGMSGFGVETLDDIDTREEKEAFLSLMKFNDLQGDNISLTNEIFETMAKETAGTPLEDWFNGDDDVQDSTSKAWIVENIVIGGNFSRDPETGLLTINTEDIVPPWNENFPQYTFQTWPRKTWDAEGNETTLYSGGEFRDDLGADSAYNDPATQAEDKILENAYIKYKKQNPDGLGWLDWYDATQGNTKPIDTASGIELQPTPGEKIDNLEMLKLHVDNGAIPTEEEVIASLTSIDSLDNNSFFEDGTPSKGLSNEIEEADGWVNYKGKALKYDSVNANRTSEEDDEPFKRTIHTFTTPDGVTVGKDFDTWLELDESTGIWNVIEQPAWV